MCSVEVRHTGVLCTCTHDQVAKIQTDTDMLFKHNTRGLESPCGSICSAGMYDNLEHTSGNAMANVAD